MKSTLVVIGVLLTLPLFGQTNGYKHDGTTFRNDRHYLPSGTSYTEYLIPPEGWQAGMRAGVQRIVVGKNGYWYYTPDHYRTFIQFKP